MAKLALKFSGPLKLSKEDQLSMAAAIETYLKNPTCQKVREEIALKVERIKANSLVSSKVEGSG
jgi:hypothetical protein